MQRIITLEDALKLDNPVYIDMRSPSEYFDGCIPSAVNIPLFTDEERAQVGTIYKKEGVDQAKHCGLSIVSVKLPEIVSTVRQYYRTGRPIIVYCWRGGMRSKSVVNVLEMMGIEAYQLLGGYKTYRKYVLASLSSLPSLPEIIVLCGSTGVGKTKLLADLAEKGIPVIDLEKLANHRGSVFGSVGLGRPSTAQNFDAQILLELQRFKQEAYIVVECESKRIGNIYLPNALYTAMKKGRKILVQTSIETRIARLIDEYMNINNKNDDEIEKSLLSLGKRLGSLKTEKLLKQFRQGNIIHFVKALLEDYYDPLYGYEQENKKVYDFVVNAEDLQQASFEIVNYLNKIGR